MANNGFDARCLELAKAFLEGEKLGGPADRNHAEELAQVIQDAIESFLSYEESACPRCGVQESAGIREGVEYCTECGVGAPR